MVLVVKRRMARAKWCVLLHWTRTEKHEKSAFWLLSLSIWKCAGQWWIAHMLKERSITGGQKYGSPEICPLENREELIAFFVAVLYLAEWASSLTSAFLDLHQCCFKCSALKIQIFYVIRASSYLNIIRECAGNSLEQ